MSGSNHYSRMSDEDRRESVERLEAEIGSHAGTVAHRRWQELDRIYDVLRRNGGELIALLEAAQSNERLQVELMRNTADGSIQAEFMHELDRGLHNLVAALGSVVDQARRFVSHYGDSPFAHEWIRRNQAVAEAPATVFLRDFRNYLLHYGTAPWQMQYEFWSEQPERPAGSAFRLEVSTDALLARYRWKASAREFIGSRSPAVELLPVVNEYLQANHELHAWRDSQFAELHSADIDAVNTLITERNLVLTSGQSAERDAFLAHVQTGIDRSSE